MMEQHYHCHHCSRAVLGIWPEENLLPLCYDCGKDWNFTEDERQKLETIWKAVAK